MKRLPYKQLVGSWKAARGGKLSKVGRSGGYPLYHWKREAGPLHIYLSAGIHGDEPAGPMAVTRLLRELPAWFRPHSWTVFPCLNPWGYEHGRRGDIRGIDLNRLWREGRGAEVRAVLKAIADKQFDLAFLMHEDYDADGFYIYELTHTGEPYSPRILRAVRKILPLDSRRLIEGRRVVGRGMIARQWAFRWSRRKLWPEAFYFISHHTGRLFTPETPSTGYPLGLRVRAQILALRAAIGALTESG